MMKGDFFFFALAGSGYIMGGLVDAHPESKRTVERPRLRQDHVSKELHGFKFSQAGCAGAAM